MYSAPLFCPILIKVGFFLQILIHVPKYEMRLKSVYWEPSWYMRTDGWMDYQRHNEYAILREHAGEQNEEPKLFLYLLYPTQILIMSRGSSGSSVIHRAVI
jgi:hypothetical protein